MTVVYLSTARWRRAAASLVARKSRANIPVHVSEAILEAKQSEWEKLVPIAQIGILALASIFIHSILILPFLGDSSSEIEKKQSPIEVAVIDQPPQPPPEPPKLIKSKLADKLKPKPRLEPLPEPVVKLPPPPAEEAPEVTAPPPVFISGISMSSTSSSGSFSVGVGNTLSGKPNEKAANPDQVKPYKAAEYAPVQALTDLPVYSSNLTQAEINAAYPVAGRTAGREEMVPMKLVIDDDGSVVKVEILEDPGLGFAEAARKLASRMKFSPARRGGRAVATEITFPIYFTLE